MHENDVRSDSAKQSFPKVVIPWPNLTLARLKAQSNALWPILRIPLKEEKSTLIATSMLLNASSEIEMIPETPEAVIVPCVPDVMVKSSANT